MTPPALRQLSLRTKLTLIFLSVMALVLAGIGTFLFFRTKSNLDNAIRDALRVRATQVATTARTHNGVSAGRMIGPGERDTQILTSDGRILDSRPTDARALVSRQEAAATTAERFIERGEHARVFVQPARIGGQPLLLAVSASLRDREKALEGLGRALLIVGPIALLLASALAYGIATAALRPVDLMRRRAAEITTADPSARLPVPTSHDEIHELAITLNEMLGRLAQAAEQERAFVANASHELRTPIATLHAELELALRHATTIDDFRQSTQEAIADTETLERLANDLLVLARADTAGLQLRQQDIDLRDAVADAANRLERAMHSDGRNVGLQANGPVIAPVDSDRLIQALRNMTENARVHGNGPVTITLEQLDDRALISVTDHGGSLTPATSDSAFQRFSRGPDAHSRPGAGLGLSIVREIARAHGGDAHLANAPSGVVCTLELPLCAPTP